MTTSSSIHFKNGSAEGTKNKQNVHKVAEKCSKNHIARPGGLQATRTMHSWAGFTKEHSVLQVSSCQGRGGIEIAKAYGSRVLLTDHDEEQNKRTAKTVSRDRRLREKVGTQVLDVTDMQSCGLHDDLDFDTIVLESTLSRYPNHTKMKILDDLQKYTNEILLHEICVVPSLQENPEAMEQVKSDMTKALGGPFEALTLDDWKELIEESGYEITHIDSGHVHYPTARNFVKEKGLGGTSKGPWHPSKKALREHKNSLRYIIVRATKKQK